MKQTITTFAGLQEYGVVLNKKVMDLGAEYFFHGEDMLERILKLDSEEIVANNEYFASVLEEGLRIAKAFNKELRPVVKKAKKSKKAKLTEEQVEILANTVEHIALLCEDALDYFNVAEVIVEGNFVEIEF